MIPTLILSCALLASSPLEQLLSDLEARRCDEAARLAPTVPTPDRPSARDRLVAKSVARGAAQCRARDPKHGVPLAALAVRLDPGDPEFLLEHAEALLGVEETAAAAEVLDRLVKQHPVKRAPQAWLLRAQLAHRAGDDVLAVGLLEPLVEDRAWKQRAEPLLAAAQEALARRGEDAVATPGTPATPTVRTTPSTARPPGPSPTPPVVEHRSGDVVAKLPGSIAEGGMTTLTVRGLTPSRVYLFKAAGSCQRWVTGTDMDGNLTSRKAMNEATGLDFRVQFGKQPSRALPVGTRGVAEESSIEFVADGPELTIQVFDESRHTSQVTCQVGSFSVVAR